MWSFVIFLVTLPHLCLCRWTEPFVLSQEMPLPPNSLGRKEILLRTNRVQWCGLLTYPLWKPFCTCPMEWCVSSTLPLSREFDPRVLDPYPLMLQWIRWALFRALLLTALHPGAPLPLSCRPLGNPSQTNSTKNEKHYLYLTLPILNCTNRFYLGLKKLVRQRSYWRRSGEFVQRHACFVNIRSSFSVYSLCWIPFSV